MNEVSETPKSWTEQDLKQYAEVMSSPEWGQMRFISLWVLLAIFFTLLVICVLKKGKSSGMERFVKKFAKLGVFIVIPGLFLIDFMVKSIPVLTFMSKNQKAIGEVDDDNKIKQNAVVNIIFFLIFALYFVYAVGYCLFKKSK